MIIIQISAQYIHKKKAVAAIKSQRSLFETLNEVLLYKLWVLISQTPPLRRREHKCSNQLFKREPQSRENEGPVVRSLPRRWEAAGDMFPLQNGGPLVRNIPRRWEIGTTVASAAAASSLRAVPPLSDLQFGNLPTFDVFHYPEPRAAVLHMPRYRCRFTLILNFALPLSICFDFIGFIPPLIFVYMYLCFFEIFLLWDVEV